MGGFVEFGGDVSIKLSNSRFAWLVDGVVDILEDMKERRAADWCRSRSPDVIGIGMGFIHVPEIPHDHREAVLCALARFATGVVSGDIELDSGLPEFDESVRRKMREISAELQRHGHSS
mgnify:CR=1 FL=1